MIPFMVGIAMFLVFYVGYLLGMAVERAHWHKLGDKARRTHTKGMM